MPARPSSAHVRANSRRVERADDEPALDRERTSAAQRAEDVVEDGQRLHADGCGQVTLLLRDGGRAEDRT